MTANNSEFNDNRATSRRRLRLAFAVCVPLFWTVSAAAECLEVKAGEKVVISEDQTVDCLKIAATGCLTIDPGVMLSIDGDTAHDTSTVHGTIVLAGTGATLKITQSDHTLNGQGKLVGRANNARVQITGNLMLTSEITIEGALQIRAGSGTFSNSGLVHANRNATPWMLTLYSGTFDGAGEYKVSANSSTTLRARGGVTATGLSGRFIIEKGALDIDENVTTTGDLVQTGGTIDIAPNKTFAAR